MGVAINDLSLLVDRPVSGGMLSNFSAAAVGGELCRSLAGFFFRASIAAALTRAMLLNGPLIAVF